MFYSSDNSEYFLVFLYISLNATKQTKSATFMAKRSHESDG